MLRMAAVEIYGGCNYACEMCPQSTGRGRDWTRKMPAEVFRRVLTDLRGHGVEYVSLHGSGEATMHPQMPDLVAYVKSLGMQCMAVTNGFYLTERLSRDLIDSGIDLLRVSGIGYDRDTYRKWMSKDAFHLVRDNALRFRQLAGNRSTLRL